LENLIDEYAKTILKAGFTLERLGEGEDAKLLIELSYIEDLKKLTDAVEKNIVFYRQYTFDSYPRLTIYDDYME
jgi:hypothetical protein